MPKSIFVTMHVLSPARFHCPTIVKIPVHWFGQYQVNFGESKRRNEFAEWHVAWLAEWHNYAECKIWKMRKEINWTEKHVCVFAAPFLAPIWVSNVFAGPFITAGLNQQGRAESSDKLYCIRVYVILNLFLLLSTIVSLFLPTNVTKLFFSKLVNCRCFFFSR